MEIFRVLSDPILPVFGILILGYLLGRSGNATVEDARMVNRFAMTVFLPILIFGLVANAPIHSFSPAPMMVYAMVEGGIFTIGYLLARRVFNRPVNESILLAFCGIFTNIAFFVLPITLLLYGPDNIRAIFTILTLDSTITIASVMIALQVINSGRVSLRRIILSIIKMPLLQAVALGIFISLTRTSIPAPIQTFIDFNGAAAAPLALFALGIVLSGTKIRVNAPILTFSIIKLLGFPIAIWVGLGFLIPSDSQAGLFLLAAAGPSGTVAFSMALLYNVKTETIAQIVTWTSILSLFSLALLA